MTVKISLKNHIAPLAAALILATSIGGVASANSGGVTYTYDALGRVIKAAYVNGLTINYTYDAAGNRTQINSTGGTSKFVVLPLIGGLVIPIY